MPEAAPASSSALRAEIAVLAGEIDTDTGKVELFSQKISELALSAWRKDPAAQSQMVQCSELKGQALDRLRLLRDAKATSERLLQSALDREQRERDKLAADAQEKIGSEVEQAGVECHEMLTAFLAGLRKFRSAAHAAGVTEAQLQASAAQAVRWAVRDFAEFSCPPPAPIEGNQRRPSFLTLGKAYGARATGNAVRLRNGPVPRSKPNGKESAIAATLRDGVPRPAGHVDIHHPLADDPIGFEIRKAR